VSNKRSAGVEAAQKLHPGTTLDEADWAMIEDSLLSFELMVIAVSAGGLAMIAITICFFTRDATFTQALSELMGGVGFYAVVPLLCVLPCIVGIAQIAISLCFGVAAAFENWADVSIQDVVRHLCRRYVDERVETVAEGLPLHCTARRAYLVLMFIFIVFQLIVAATLLGMINDFATEVNQGAVGSAQGTVKNLLDYSTAVFDACCASNGWTQMGYALMCAPGTSTTTNCTLPARYQLAAPQLCVCYTQTNQSHAAAVDYARSSGVCDVLANAFVSISDSDLIPGTTVSIRALIAPDVYSFPVVGNYSSVFGCGVGFIRGFQWAATKYSVEIAQPYIVAILAITLFQLASLVLGTYMVCVRPAPNVAMDAYGNIVRSPPPSAAASVASPPVLGLRGVIAHRRAFNAAQGTPNGAALMSPSIVGVPKMRTRGPRAPATGALSPLSLAPASAATLTSPERMALAAVPTAAAPSELLSPQLMALKAKPTTSSGHLPRNIDDIM